MVEQADGLGIAILYEDFLRHLRGEAIRAARGRAQKLPVPRRRPDAARLALHGECPACESGRQVAANYLRILATADPESEVGRAAGQELRGLCIPHLVQGLSARFLHGGGDCLLAIYLRGEAELRADLQEFIRKERCQHRDEPLRRAGRRLAARGPSGGGRATTQESTVQLRAPEREERSRAEDKGARDFCRWGRLLRLAGANPAPQVRRVGDAQGEAGRGREPSRRSAARGPGGDGPFGAILGEIGPARYRYSRRNSGPTIEKTVYWYLMDSDSQRLALEPSFDQGVFASPEEALRMLTHPGDRDILKRAVALHKARNVGVFP